MTGRFFVAALLLAGCYDPNIPDKGFICSVKQICPDGYNCVNGVCRTPGAKTDPGDLARVLPTQFPDLATPGMPTPPQDFGAPGCGMVGAHCANVGACCSGLTCTNGSCLTSPMPSPTCVASGASCTASTTCCSGLTCMSGTCSSTPACVAAGGNCQQTSDCCSGATCSFGSCTTCVADNGSCETSSDCCSVDCDYDNFVCDPGNGMGCAPSGAGCIDSSECCSDNCGFFSGKCH